MQVCELWKTYLHQQKIWQKCVEKYAKRREEFINLIVPFIGCDCGLQISAVFHPTGLVEAAAQAGRRQSDGPSGL